MGTRFMCTLEAPIHHNIKETIVKADETDTSIVMRRWTNTTRLYKNKVTEAALKVEKESKTGEFAEMAPYVSGKRGKEVFINGDPEFGVSCSPPCFHHPPGFSSKAGFHHIRVYSTKKPNADISCFSRDRYGPPARSSVSSTTFPRVTTCCSASSARQRRHLPRSSSSPRWAAASYRAGNRPITKWRYREFMYIA